MALRYETDLPRSSDFLLTISHWTTLIMGIIGDVLNFRLEKISPDPDTHGVQPICLI